ncbi:MAG: MerR family DNA-binding transcriptional regulator [Gemmatimonadales bacterium]
MKQYYTPRELSDALDVSESSIKRWVDDGLLAATRTAGGHRRIAIAEAVRFLRSSGIAVSGPIRMFGGRVSVVSVDGTSPDALGGQLLDALQRDDGETSRSLLLGAFLGGWTIAALADGPIRLAMSAIGELWSHSDQGIVIEHRAVDSILQTLGQLRGLLPPPRADAPGAIGGTPAGDPYLLPSQLTAAALAEVGFRDRNLGPDTPFAVLMDATRRYRARLVWLSISVPHGDDRRLRDDLLTLADDLAPLGATLGFGGRHAPFVPPGSRAMRFAGIGELVAYARGLLVARADAGAKAPA